MTALSPIAPMARLIRMSDNTVRATTRNLLGGTGRTSVLDAAGNCALAVPLSDAGDTSAADVAAGRGSFAHELLSGGGGPGGGVSVPLLLSISLDGGASWDTHRLVQKPLRDMRPEALTLSESGEDIFTLYSQTAAGGGHGTMANCRLADVLGGAPGSISPYSGYGFISADSTLPFACGLFFPDASIFQDVPGNGAWDAGAVGRLLFVCVLPTTGFTTDYDLAFGLPTTLDTWSDNVQHALATLVERLGGVVLSGDTQPLGSRGHFVADCSDAVLSVARTFPGVVCDGTPSAAALGGTYGLSNARTSGHEVARAVVVGSVGAPSGLTFTGDLPADTILDETTTALILPGATIEPDETVLHGVACFEGGSSDAGFPSGGTITALTQVNRSPSGGRDAFADCLPLVGINVSEKAGGVYYYDTMGRLVPLNNSQSIPVLDLCVDTHNDAIDIATPHGVYHRTSDIANTTDAWTPVGGLTARVVRLAGVPTLAPDFILYAQVVDPQNSALDGIYQYHPATAIAGLGYNGWVRVLASQNILDFVSTDDHSIFYLDKTDQTRLNLYDFTASPPTTTTFALPAGVNALRVDRVTGQTTDTVYVTTTGDAQAAYYTAFTTAWQPLVAAQLAVGANLKVNRFAGPNVVVNTGASAVTVEALACTDDGLFFATTVTPTLASDWTSANDQNGLAGIAVTHATAGAYQTILGVNTSRMFAATASELYMSGNSGVQWDDVTKSRVDLGPYLKDLVVSATGAPPTNSVQTVGPMASSPIGAAGSTHVQVASYLGFPILPPTWYYLRRLTQRGSWEYRLVNPDCPYSALKRDQLTDIEANESQGAGMASAILAAVTRKWLGENSQAQTVLHIPSYFTQTDAALRTLQPGQAVLVTMHGTIPGTSSTGDIVDTVYVDFTATTFYVTRHAWTIPADGAGYIDTTTELSTVLRSAAPSGGDIASDLQDQLRALKVWTAGKRRR